MSPAPSPAEPPRSRGLTAAAAAFGLLFALLRLRPLDVPDLWWHLSMGRGVLASGARRFPDPTGPDPTREYIDPEWLFDVLLLGSWEAAGVGGTFVLIALCAAASFLLCAAAARAMIERSGSSASAAGAAALIAALLAAGGAQLRIVQRPQALFLVLLPAALLCAARVRVDGGGGRPERAPARRRWALLGLAVLAAWSQAHSSVFLSPLLVALALVPDGRFARLDRWGCTLLAGAVLAPLASPFGLGIVHQVLSHAGTDAASSIVDMAPPGLAAFQPLRGFGGTPWGPAVAFPELLTALGLVGLLVTRRREFVGPLLLALLGLALAITANRFLAAWSLLAAPAGAAGLATLLDRIESRERTSRRVAPLVLCAALAAVAGTSWGVPLLQPRLEQRAEPADVADALLRLDLTGPGVVFAHYDLGGYLGWRGEGRLRVFIDGRTPTHFDEAWLAAWREASSDIDAFEALAAEHGIDGAVPSARQPLCRQLAASPGWTARSWSPQYALFARTDVAGSPAVELLRPCDGPFTQLAACRADGLLEPRMEEVHRLLEEVPSATAVARLGVLLALDCGATPRTDLAAPLLGHVERRAPHDPDLHWLRGLLAARRGEARLAMQHLDAAPDTPPVRTLRLEILRAADRPEAARAEAEALVRELGDRTDAGTWDHLAWACDQLGDHVCADAARAGGEPSR
jgi:hypothetical protein